jgi:zinc protease
MIHNPSASLPKTSLPGPHDIIRERLSNGITVLLRPNPNSLSVSMAGYLQAGSLYEPEEKLGLADFTAESLLRGTRQSTFQEIFEDLESLGASLRFSGGTHTAGFAGKSLAADLDTILELMAEALMEPVFPDKHIERLRAQALIGLDLRAQDTSEMASLGFDQIAFANHPYRRPEDGYPETIAAITRDDMVSFHHKHYGPRGMVISLVGAVDPIKVVKNLEALFGKWENPDQPEIIEVGDPSRLTKTIHNHHVIPEKSQADIVLGCVGPRRESPDFIPARLGNSVLGQFGMMGRIGESVRNKAGYAYYAYSSLSSSIGPGAWTVSAGVDPNNLDHALELIIKELERFVSEPVDEEELQDSQSSIIGKLPLALESNAGVAGALLTIERHNLGLDYFQKFEETISQVTRERALETAQMYLDPNRLAISTAGPER